MSTSNTTKGKFWRYRVETRKPGTCIRPLTMCDGIERAIEVAMQQQAELPGGKTIIHDRVTDTYQEWL